MSVLDQIGHLARQVFRTFHPMLSFVVVNELLRRNEFVSAADVGQALQLEADTVASELTNLHKKGFVYRYRYVEGAAGLEFDFWAFNYYAFVNIVRFSVLRLKHSEQEKMGGTAGAGPGRGSTARAGYVCDKCNRAVPWEEFARLNMSTICPARGCGGALGSERKRARAGLQPLEQLASALRRITDAAGEDGKLVPPPSTQKRETIILEARKKAIIDRPELLNKQVHLGVRRQKDIVVRVGEVVSDVVAAALPPELSSLSHIHDAPPPAKPLPPWLKSQEKEDEKKVASSGQLELKTEENMQSRNGPDENHRDQVPLEATLEEFATQLPHQIEILDGEDHVEHLFGELDSEDDLAWASACMVAVQGKNVPISQVTNEMLVSMTEKEYEAYFELYERECRTRIEQLLQ